MALDLCSLSDLRGADGSDAVGFLDGMGYVTKYDTLLSSLITAVGKRFENYCNRLFEYGASLTEYYSGSANETFIVVKRPPIASVASLYDDTDRVFGSDTLIDADDYVVGDQTVELKYSKFLKGILNIKVTYAGGYETATIPGDLKLAAMMQVAFIFKRRADLGLTGISGEGGSISVQYPMKLLPEVEAILQAYKIWKI